MSCKVSFGSGKCHKYDGKSVTQKSLKLKNFHKYFTNIFHIEKVLYREIYLLKVEKYAPPGTGLLKVKHAEMI